ncbi:MAG: DNA circularization N-terminal domain-containing protein [Treponema sp.]|nr:DNA circularization N-terminal domain-containing protein [Treponema sp.]
MSSPRFDTSLPDLYKENWREAYRADKEDVPRLSSYQAPDGEPVTFIYKNLDFTGGQSIDTAEYPFFGLWSNETLNQKPQIITVHGFLRGEYYLKQRSALIEALIVPTSDDSPGYFDHPLWGRFKVIVDNYFIQESVNESGQCEISLTLKRAGISLDRRTADLMPEKLIKPKEVAQIAIEEFSQVAVKDVNESVHIEINTVTFLQSFSQLKIQLLKMVGRIQAPITILNSVTNEITGISNLITQGVKSPMVLAQTMVNAFFSIVGAVASIKESAESVIKYFFSSDNKKNLVMMFLSSESFKIPVEAVTVSQMKTRTSVENLYRTVSLCACAELLIQMDDVTLNEMNGYYVLYLNLENKINLEDPGLYKAIIEMRSALSQTLKQKVMNNEQKKNIVKPVPLLLLAHYLGCNDEKLRAMNLIEDSLLVSGETSYV